MNGINSTILSVISNTVFVILKFIVGFFTGSVALISEAVHSCMDLFASVITFFSIRIANKPADKNHPYGHGKAENIAGTIETLLILVAGVWIIVESTNKLMHPQELRLPELGIAVLLLAALSNLIISRIIYRVANRENSVAMKSNALHLITDVYTSLGIAASLFLVYLTKWYWLDPIIAIGTAIFIMYKAIIMLRETFPPLMDSCLSPEEESQIREIIQRYQLEYIEFHMFRTRRSGPEEYIDFHLVMPSSVSVETAHTLCDKIETDIEAHFPKAQILIHVEPEEECLLTNR